MSRPRVPLAAETMARLRVSAAREFAALGFEDASLNRILEDAGLAKSSFYHHVGSKQALLNGLLAYLVDTVRVAVALPDPATLTAESFWPAWSEVLTRLDAVGESSPELMTLARVVHEARGTEALRELRECGVVTARAYVARGQALGVVRLDVPADLLAPIAVAALLAIDAWSLGAHDPTDDPDAAVTAALCMVRTALRGS